MDNNKFTKGKWEIHKHAFSCVISEEDSFVIANCGSASSNFENFEDKQKYNALLISKAPELLEMLIQILKEHEIGIIQGLDSRKARDLIKEATEL